MVFTDEKKWNLDGPDGWNSYWHDLRKEPLIFSKRNFGGGSLMVWRAISGHGKIGLSAVSSKMNSIDYQNVVGPPIDRYQAWLNGRPIKFQQDNASIHVSRSTLRWFEARDIPLLKWPNRAPDLKIMENVWRILARRVYANNKQYENVQELWNAIKREFKNLEQDVIDNLVSSMPNRIYQVINRNGGLSDYSIVFYCIFVE